MKVTLQQNSNNDTTPYTAQIEISTISVDFDTQFRIPVSKRVNGSVTYMADICGFQVEADNPETTVTLIEKLLSSLVNLARLPSYVFIARRSHKMYPVYIYGDEVFATTPGGPVFKHVELAKVREYLSDYMHTIGALGVPGRSEKLHVRGINGETLGLMRPIFYLKKRPQDHDDNEFWAPVFLSADGDTINTYAASGLRIVDVDQGHEILRLQSQVAQALIADKRLFQEYDLRVDRLLPEYWQQVEGTLKPLPNKLVFGDTQLKTYQEGRSIIAVEYRENEDRYSLYIGKDIDDLHLRSTKDLIRRGLINDPKALKVVAY